MKFIPASYLPKLKRIKLYKQIAFTMLIVNKDHWSLYNQNSWKYEKCSELSLAFIYKA